MNDNLKLEAEHSAMVKALFKSDEAIYSSLKPGDCTYTHGVLALAGEGGELVRAVRAWSRAVAEGPREKLEAAHGKIAEERGDLEFYLEAERQRLGFTRADDMNALMPSDGTSPIRDVSEILLDLWEAEAAAVDPCKRLVIYRKHEQTGETPEVNAAQLVIQNERAKMAISIYAGLLDELGRVVGVSLEDALNANLAKLLKGEKPRYATGTYSDEQATARADKGGHDQDLDDGPDKDPDADLNEPLGEKQACATDGEPCESCT